jgi:hypothetical protein
MDGMKYTQHKIHSDQILELQFKLKLMECKHQAIAVNWKLCFNPLQPSPMNYNMRNELDW